MAMSLAALFQFKFASIEWLNKVRTKEQKNRQYCVTVKEEEIQISVLFFCFLCNSDDEIY